MRTLLHKMKRFPVGAFEQEFGFEPTSALADAVIHEMEQRLVDSHLTELEKSYNEADRRERAVVSDCKGVKNPEQLGTMKYGLKEARESLREAKENFWRAHGLAKEAGFSVRERHADYASSLSRWQ